MGIPRSCDRRRQSGIGDDGGRTHRKPFIAGIGRMGQRRSSGLVMPENRDDAFRHGRSNAVEKRKAAILMTEEAQGRQHALDGFDQRLGRGFRAIGIGLAERQKIGQQFQNRNGIARDMSAIGQNLAFQLVLQIAPGGACRRWRNRQSQSGECQCDAGAQPFLAIIHGGGNGAQITHLHGKRAHEAAIGGEFGARQNKV